MFGSGPNPKRLSRGGIIRWETSCPEAGCGKKFTDPDKSKSKKAWKSHDLNVHVSQRRKKAKAAKTLKAKQAKELAAAEKKADIAAARKAGRERNEKAKEANENRGWRSTKPSSGLYTRGIPNVKDGQKVTGIVYDRDGKPVPHHVLKKYVQGWDD